MTIYAFTLRVLPEPVTSKLYASSSIEFKNLWRDFDQISLHKGCVNLENFIAANQIISAY